VAVDVPDVVRLVGSCDEVEVLRKHEDEAWHQSNRAGFYGLSAAERTVTKTINYCKKAGAEPVFLNAETMETMYRHWFLAKWLASKLLARQLREANLSLVFCDCVSSVLYQRCTSAYELLKHAILPYVDHGSNACASQVIAA
jgi:hypothetical protein